LSSCITTYAATVRENVARLQTSSRLTDQKVCSNIERVFVYRPFLTRSGRVSTAKQSVEGSDAVGGEQLPDGVQSRPGREFMASLAKGLAVLGAFGEHRPMMSLSEAAAVAGLSRAAARRVLLTLSELGYVTQDGRDFTLAPRILELGFSYLSIQSWIDRAGPLMKQLSDEFQESCSAAILHGTEIVFVGRVSPPSRIMTTSVAIGRRLPAFHTALGRIQLGFLGADEIWKRLKSVHVESFTPSTIIDRAALKERVLADHQQGFSIVDEELERGLRALAVPIVTRSAKNVGAINISAQASRTTRNEMRDLFLPRLTDAARQISQTLA
jgi:IclR family transcriptional regulator, pca regulon regulatory protein